MNNGNVLVSGASVAGLAVAYWLHHYGFTPTVVERAAAPRDGGHAVDLRAAARDAVEPDGTARRGPPSEPSAPGAWPTSTAPTSGSPTMSSDVLGDSGGAIAELEILRGDLVRILYGAARDEVEFIFDDSITDLAQGDDGVKAFFARASLGCFDLVVGADGLHSNVRAIAFGDEDRVRARSRQLRVDLHRRQSRADLDGWELLLQQSRQDRRHVPGEGTTTR